MSAVHLLVWFIRFEDLGASCFPMDGTANNQPTLYFFSSLNCQHPNGKNLPPPSLTTKSKTNLKSKPPRLNSSCLSNKLSPIYISKMYWSIYIVFFNIVFSILASNSSILHPIPAKIPTSPKDLRKYHVR